MSVRFAASLVTGGLFLVLLATASGHLYSIDGLQYFRVAERIVYDRSLTFQPPLYWGGPITDPITPVGYSLAQIPAVVLALPWRSLQPALGTAPYDSALLYGDPFYTASAWVNPLVVALTGGVLVYAGRRLGMTPRVAIAVALAAVLGSPLLFYGKADFAQPLAAFLLLAAAATTLDILDRRRVPPGLLASILALAILTRPVDGLLVAGVVGLALILPSPSWDPVRDARAAVLDAAVGVIVGFGGTLLVDYLRRGNPVDFGYQPTFTGSIPMGTIAELVSPGRGLILFFPVAILALWGAWRLWRERRLRSLLLLGLPILLYVPLYAKWQGLGGWAYGPRFMTPLVPLLALLAGVAVEDGRRRRAAFAAFGALATIGFLENLAPLAVDQFRFWGAYGDSTYGTAGFWRQFEPGAFAPLGSWQYYDASAGPDILWLRDAAASHGISVVAGACLLGGGVLLLALAWRAARAPVPAAR